MQSSPADSRRSSSSCTDSSKSSFSTVSCHIYIWPLTSSPDIFCSSKFLFHISAHLHWDPFLLAVPPVGSTTVCIQHTRLVNQLPEERDQLVKGVQAAAVLGWTEWTGPSSGSADGQTEWAQFESEFKGSGLSFYLPTLHSTFMDWFLQGP